jgi:tRNA-dihydrouridine synthase B
MKPYLKLAKGAMLAPMADYTNIAFRTLAHEYGASLVFTEFVSAKALLFKNKKTQKMIQVSEKEKPVMLQLFGTNPEDIGQAIKIVEKNHPDHFSGYDLNAHCAVPKAHKGNYGAYLLDYPELVGDIMGSMRCATEKNVSLKIMLGNKKENYLEVAKIAESKGADAICLHPRIGPGYAMTPKLKDIKLLKNEMKIPVIGNGGIDSVEKYKEMIDFTGCDHAMLGRATLGNAFLFKQIKEHEEGKKVSIRKKEDIYIEGKRYLELADEFELHVNDIRGYFIALASDFEGAKDLRNKFAVSKTIKEIKNSFNEFFN